MVHDAAGRHEIQTASLEQVGLSASVTMRSVSPIRTCAVGRKTMGVTSSRWLEMPPNDPPQYVRRFEQLRPYWNVPRRAFEGWPPSNKRQAPWPMCAWDEETSREADRWRQGAASIPIVTSSPVVPCLPDCFGAAGRSQGTIRQGDRRSRENRADAAARCAGYVSPAAVRNPDWSKPTGPAVIRVQMVSDGKRESQTLDASGPETA